VHKRIGIIGGMSPESTITYYEYITHTYTERFGDYGYPEIIIYSVSFQPYVDWPRAERWDLVAEGLSAAARKLEAAGADFFVVATNTMHIVFDEIAASVGIPGLSLLDAVRDYASARGMRTLGLLGTSFTMEKPFYQDALGESGIRVIVPDSGDRDVINNVIYDELVRGVVRDESRRHFVRVIDELASRGAEGVILGCTEIPLLIQAEYCDLPLLDSTRIHAEAALQYALQA
jgi:aspartate racemase